jgi:hypothetical protein
MTIQEKLETTKLSTLVREGSTYYPKGEGDYIVRGDNGETRVCAIGAAAVALTGPVLPAYTAADPAKNRYQDGFRNVDKAINALLLTYNREDTADKANAMKKYLLEKGSDNPYYATLSERAFLIQVISYLNDNAGWSREEIADLLEYIGL